MKPRPKGLKERIRELESSEIGNYRIIEGLHKEIDALKAKLARAKDYAWFNPECGCKNEDCLKDFNERWKREVEGRG